MSKPTIDQPYRLLPRKLYDCRVMAYSTISKFEAEMFGIPVNMDLTNGKKLPNEALYERVEVMINAERILEIFATGGYIDLMHRKDAVELYHVYQKYINDWNDNSQGTLNVDNRKPVEILNDMDRLAQTLFDSAKAYIAVDSVQSTNPFDMGIGTLDFSGRFNDGQGHVYDSNNPNLNVRVDRGTGVVRTDGGSGAVTSYDIADVGSSSIEYQTSNAHTWVGDTVPVLDLSKFKRNRNQIQ